MIPASRIAVVAGNGAEASAWATDRGLSRKEWFYAASRDRVTGAVVSDVVFTGTYLRRKDWEVVFRQLRGCQLAAQCRRVICVGSPN